MELARGDVLMRFDDDDYYAPAYVERMLELLGDDDYLTLSGWFAYSQVHGKFCYWETDALWPVQFVLSPHDLFLPVSTAGLAPESVRWQVNGYGFASAWRRRVAERGAFPGPGCTARMPAFVDALVDAGFARAMAPMSRAWRCISSTTTTSHGLPAVRVARIHARQIFSGLHPGQRWQRAGRSPISSTPLIYDSFAQAGARKPTGPTRCTTTAAVVLARTVIASPAPGSLANTRLSPGRTGTLTSGPSDSDTVIEPSLLAR